MTETERPFPNPICLTGGIATGKSRVAEWFSARNWRVICSDAIVHRLYEPGRPLPALLAKEFGAEILDARGGVHRPALAAIVFRVEGALRRLNALVHPPVREAWQREAAEAVREGKRAMVVIPLAYEADAAREFAQTWVVACSVREQERRLRDRGLDARQIGERLRVQWPLQKKVDLADRVVWNDGPWAATEEQLELLNA